MKINWIVIVLMIILIPLWPVSFIILVLCLRFKIVTTWVLFYKSTNNPSFVKIVGQRGVIDIAIVRKVRGVKTFVFRYTRWQLWEDNVWVPSIFKCNLTFNELLDNYNNGLQDEEVKNRLRWYGICDIWVPTKSIPYIIFY